MKSNRCYLLVGLILVILTSCNQSKIETEEELVYEPFTYTGATIEVTDSADRTVEVPYKPESIATLYATTGHMVVMLDGGDKIVAVNNGLKRDILLNDLEPAIGEADLTVISGQINFESLLARNVTLVMIPLDIYSDDKQRNLLESIGLPYIVVDYQSVEEQIEVVEMIATILGNEEEAKQFRTFNEEIIQILDERLGRLTEEEMVRVYHSINEATCTVEEGTLAADWMAHAGGINVSLGGDLKRDGDKYYTNLEQILLWNPEVIYCNESGVPKYIMNSDQWQQIEATKNERVVQLPIGISRWGHKTSIETSLAMLWVATDLYPERFNDIDTMAYYKTFYDTLFEFDLTEEMYTAMTIGNQMRLPKDLEEIK